MSLSNLPPGCTSADIERAFGDQPAAAELFETAYKTDKSACPFNLSEEEVLAALDRIAEDDSLSMVVESIAAFARDLGYDDALYEIGLQQHLEDPAEAD